MRAVVTAAMLLTGFAWVAMAAQPSAATAVTPEPPARILASLPTPPVGDKAAGELLHEAADAITAGHDKEAFQAMAMAQTSLRERSAPGLQSGVISDQPAITLISEGLQALAAGKRGTCMRMIEAAEASTEGP